MYVKLLKQSDINTYIVNSSTLSPHIQICHNTYKTVKKRGEPKAREIQNVKCSARRV